MLSYIENYTAAFSIKFVI